MKKLLIITLLFSSIANAYPIDENGDPIPFERDCDKKEQILFKMVMGIADLNIPTKNSPAFEDIVLKFENDNECNMSDYWEHL